jgi:hypothetical protein
MSLSGAFPFDHRPTSSYSFYPPDSGFPEPGFFGPPFAPWQRMIASSLATHNNATQERVDLKIIKNKTWIWQG